MSFTRDLPRLETERLILTLPDPEFAPCMLAYVQENRAHLAPWDPVRGPEHYTLAHWRWQLSANREEFFQDRSCRFVVCLRELEKGPVIGQCNFTAFVRGAFHACTLGYNVGAAYEGQGYITEALQAAIAFMFDELKLHRIQANYMPRNARSARVLERLEFVTEGEAKDYLYIAGRWEDHVLTALTNPNLPAPAAAP